MHKSITWIFDFVAYMRTLEKFLGKIKLFSRFEAILQYLEFANFSNVKGVTAL